MLLDRFLWEVMVACSCSVGGVWLFRLCLMKLAWLLKFLHMEEAVYGLLNATSSNFSLLAGLAHTVFCFTLLPRWTCSLYPVSSSSVARLPALYWEMAHLSSLLNFNKFKSYCQVAFICVFCYFSLTFIELHLLKWTNYKTRNTRYTFCTICHDLVFFCAKM